MYVMSVMSEVVFFVCFTSAPANKKKHSLDLIDSDTEQKKSAEAGQCLVLMR